MRRKGRGLRKKYLIREGTNSDGKIKTIKYVTKRKQLPDIIEEYLT